MRARERERGEREIEREREIIESDLKIKCIWDIRTDNPSLAVQILNVILDQSFQIDRSRESENKRENDIERYKFFLLLRKQFKGGELKEHCHRKAKKESKTSTDKRKRKRER